MVIHDNIILAFFAIDSLKHTGLTFEIRKQRLLPYNRPSFIIIIGPS